MVTGVSPSPPPLHAFTFVARWVQHSLFQLVMLVDFHRMSLPYPRQHGFLPVADALVKTSYWRFCLWGSKAAVPYVTHPPLLGTRSFTFVLRFFSAVKELGTPRCSFFSEESVFDNGKRHSPSPRQNPRLFFLTSRVKYVFRLQQAFSDHRLTYASPLHAQKPRIFFCFYTQAGFVNDRLASEQPVPLGPLGLRSRLAEERERQTGSQRQSAGDVWHDMDSISFFRAVHGS